MDRPPSPLFRQVAIEAASGTQIGAALTTHWRGVAAFTAVAFVLLAALIAFVAVVEYSPVHRVAAFVDARGGLVRLKAPLDGRVTRLAVNDGAMVRKGDLLAVIGSERLREEGGGERTAVRQQLDAEKATIEREIEAARQEAAVNRLMLERRLHGLREERETLRADIRSGERLLASLIAQSDHVASAAAEGYLPRQQAAQKRDEVSAQESRLASARGAAARVERDIETSEAERRLVDARLAGVIENRQRSSGELNRLRVQSEMDAEQVVRAPQDGRVSFASLAEGQSVEAGQPLFTIAPQDDPLIVKLLVAPAAVASVRPGVDFKLAFRAYPQERFGLFDGEDRQRQRDPVAARRGAAGGGRRQRADVRRHRVAARRAPRHARRGAAAQARHARRRAGADRAPHGARVAARPDPARPQRQRRPRPRAADEARR